MISKNKCKLFVFNPTCEMAIANGRISYMPPVNLRKFEDDLSMLPCFFGDSKDFVLISQKIDSYFVEYLNFLGFELPQFIMSKDDFIPKNKIDLLCPWGWSPAIHNKFKHFLQYCTDEWHINPMAKWEKNHNKLLSRETTYDFIIQLNNTNKKSYGIIEIPQIPLKVRTLEEIKVRLYLIMHYLV